MERSSCHIAVENTVVDGACRRRCGVPAIEALSDVLPGGDTCLETGLDNMEHEAAGEEGQALAP